MTDFSSLTIDSCQVFAGRVILHSISMAADLTW